MAVGVLAGQGLHLIKLRTNVHRLKGNDIGFFLLEKRFDARLALRPCARPGMVAIQPRFSIRPLRRGKGGRETDRQGKGFGAIPKTFHPLSLAHSDREFQDVFTAFGGRVTGLGKEFIKESL